MAGYLEIAESVREEFGLSRRKAVRMVREVIRFTFEELAHKGYLYIRELGSFKVRWKRKEPSIVFMEGTSIRDEFKRRAKASLIKN